ncbi:hypothetical protein AUQ42_12940 [Thalassospira sp. MCCC 1A02491]|nr:hypothetical protein AUQ42_12940 [Thalassospira sp. MCCC 1A02491]
MVYQNRWYTILGASRLSLEKKISVYAVEKQLVKLAFEMVFLAKFDFVLTFGVFNMVYQNQARQRSCVPSYR